MLLIVPKSYDVIVVPSSCPETGLVKLEPPLALAFAAGPLIQPSPAVPESPVFHSNGNRYAHYRIMSSKRRHRMVDVPPQAPRLHLTSRNACCNRGSSSISSTPSSTPLVWPLALVSKEASRTTIANGMRLALVPFGPSWGTASTSIWTGKARRWQRRSLA